MYVDPFWAGVVCTIFAEVVAIIIGTAVSVGKSKNNRK